jgi:hypothetical protein
MSPLPPVQQLLSKGVVAPSQYPRDLRFPSPYPLLTPNAEPGKPQEPQPEEHEVMQGRNQIKKLKAPQPRNRRTELPKVALNSVEQSSPEVTAKKSAPTALGLHQQRLYPSILSTPADRVVPHSNRAPASRSSSMYSHPANEGLQNVLSNGTTWVELMEGVEYGTSSYQQFVSPIATGLAISPSPSKKRPHKKVRATSTVLLC